MLTHKQAKPTIIAIDGSLDDFCNWIDGIYDHDAKAFKAMLASKTDDELVQMFNNNKVSEWDLKDHLPTNRFWHIIDLIEA